MRNHWKQIGYSSVFHKKTTKFKKKGKCDRKRKRKNPKGECAVYGLHNGDGVVMYIGQTKTSLLLRFSYHKKAAKTGLTDLYHWWRWNEAAGKNIEMIVLEANAIWDFTEVVWIERYRKEGRPLCNMTSGGRSKVIKLADRLTVKKISPPRTDTERQIDLTDWRTF